jgi:hypothetical protein
VVQGVVVAGLVQQALPEVRPVVVVSHGPDDLRAQVLAGRLNDGPELYIGFRIALVREVSGEDDRFRPRTGCFDLFEELHEPLFAVYDAVKGIRTSQQVGIAQVE